MRLARYGHIIMFALLGLGVLPMEQNTSELQSILAFDFSSAASRTESRFSKGMRSCVFGTLLNGVICFFLQSATVLFFSCLCHLAGACLLISSPYIDELLAETMVAMYSEGFVLFTLLSPLLEQVWQNSICFERA